MLKTGSLASRVGNTRRCLATSRLLRGGTHEGTALKWGELEQQAEISGVRYPAAAVSSNPEPSIFDFYFRLGPTDCFDFVIIFINNCIYWS